VSHAAAIVDTHVVVGALLIGAGASPLTRVLDGMLAAAFPFVVSEALLAEYRAVLEQPGIRELHGLTAVQIDTLLTDLALHAIVLAPAPADAAPDPGHQVLWDLLAARPDLCLVSRDKTLLQSAALRGRVVSPRDLVAIG
jgi:predicted nucleic acid-binding protein